MRAVITAAGLGTRFLPVTKALPKELLPVLDRPMVQYAVEEAVASGAREIVLVTSLGKRALEDYFDRSWELEHFLQRKKERGLLKEVRRVTELAHFCYVRQGQPRGLGDAVLAAQAVVGQEPFALLLPDDIILAEPPALKQMLEVFSRFQSPVVAVERLPRERTRDYGVIEAEQVENRVYRVRNLVEKPEPDKAPSDLTVTGRYILPPAIFSCLRRTPPGKGKEVQLTDALNLLAKEQTLLAYEFRGRRYDVGTPLGLLQASLAFSLERADMRQEITRYLGRLLRGKG